MQDFYGENLAAEKDLVLLWANVKLFLFRKNKQNQESNIFLSNYAHVFPLTHTFPQFFK